MNLTEPEPHFLELLSDAHSADTALLLVIDHVSDEHLIRLLESLSVAIAGKDWDTARSLRQTLLDDLPEGKEVALTYACAAAGMEGFAADLAAAFASVALDLSKWVREHGPSSDDRFGNGNTKRAVMAAEFRLREAYSLTVGWAAVASGRLSHRALVSSNPVVHARNVASDVDASTWCAAYSYGFESGESQATRQAEAKKEAEYSKVDVLEALKDLDEGTAKAEPAGDRVVVVPAIGSADSSIGREVGRALRSVIGVALPLVYASHDQVEAARAVLSNEMPHAVDVINSLIADVRHGKPIRLRPTVLLGEAGGGKSRLARRLCEELGLPFGTLDAATTADQSVVGCPRRWTGGHPSQPVSVVEQFRVANPAIVIDELEKAGRSTAGSLHDGLLSMLERSTAKAWRDQYVDAEVDISHVSWLFTANSLEGIPGPLRNRLRVLRVPRPGKEHLPSITSYVLRELLEERGIDPAWEPPLDGSEIAAVVDAWGEDGSVRDLRRFVEGILAVRSTTAIRN